jgi:hypothetical protein
LVQLVQVVALRSGADATAGRFLDLASWSTVVHFGGDALMNQADGMLSPVGESRCSVAAH